MHWEELSSADGFAMSMIAMIFLSLGVASMVIFKVARNCGKEESEEDLLIEEAYRTAQAPPPPVAEEAPKAGPPWEREADWWQEKS